MTTTDTPTEPQARWCWAHPHRHPHVTPTARERPDLGNAVLCDACYLRWTRDQENRP